MKTLITIPCMDMVPAQFSHSLASLQRVGDTAVAFQIGSLIYTSRNELAQRSIRMGSDFTLWFDSDMVFGPDTVERLHKTMKETGADIVSGLYYRRTPPFSPVVVKELRVNEAQGMTEMVEFEEIPSEPFEADGVGFGCVLMPTDIFIDIQQEYHDLFTPVNRMGEDLSFCWRAKSMGFKIVVDPRIKLGHVGHSIIDESFYEAYKVAESRKAK